MILSMYIRHQEFRSPISSTTRWTVARTFFKPKQFLYIYNYHFRHRKLFWDCSLAPIRCGKTHLPDLSWKSMGIFLICQVCRWCLFNFTKVLPESKLTMGIWYFVSIYSSAVFHFELLLCELIDGWICYRIY